MLSIPVYAILIWSFFQPSIASYVFLFFVACFEVWLLVAYSFGKADLVSSYLKIESDLSFIFHMGAMAII